LEWVKRVYIFEEYVLGTGEDESAKRNCEGGLSECGLSKFTSMSKLNAGVLMSGKRGEFSHVYL
jgi:hypothetical protein